MSLGPILAGRVAVVTGAGSGIGRAVAGRLLHAGARVACVDVNIASARATVDALKATQQAYQASCYGQEDPADPCVALAADVTRHQDCTRVVDEAADALRVCPSILVNSAGITQDGFVTGITEQQWDAVLDVNLKGTFLMSQKFTARYLRSKTEAADSCHSSASIVNISSIIGKVGNIGQANYAASKAGVIGLTKTLARELARHGVRANVVLPGFIHTPMSAAVPEKVIQKMLAQIPAARMGEPDEIANTVAFLSSDLASYITGAQIEVTGGMHC
eukprot:TRINITY_DN28652_c0_g1_i2.p1 TRINITY_DN28652_c0_g1~~TRINITY_DN28652_c0_g1_i2.p1  ORF type:complete len:300 (+),score=78.51 TRINITY_DN28652_c0_g1_i2:78-902(+)